MTTQQLETQSPRGTGNQVRWDASLLEASTDDAVEAWKRSLHGFAKRLPPRQQAEFIMALDSACYFMHGESARVANGGLHPKHHLINYHAFFIQHIAPGSSVIDLGSGVGALALAIARQCGAKVTGIEWTSKNITQARAVAAGTSPAPVYILGDITTLRAPGRFDTIVLSNVLEHISARVERLRLWQAWYEPTRILIRVPAFDRDWRVAWKKELGVEWRCDPTHETEYTEQQLREELVAAGLRVGSIERRWGELYCIANT